MRNMITKMVSAALVAGAAVSASAQDLAKPSGFSARLGFFNPSEKSTRVATDDAWLAAGVDYKFGAPTSLLGLKGGYTFSIDYASKSGSRIVPLVVSYRVQQDKFYYFAGVGASFVHPDGGNSDTLFAYQLGAGYDVAKQGPLPIFLEVKFLGAEKKEYNGFGFYAGVKF